MPVTTTTIYGSKSYENLVLRHTPTAAFGPYASATNTISDMTNKNYLSASLVTGASFSSQIPFFALASEQYTFNISSSNKIVIKENSSSYTKALGSGKFASGDEGSEFSVEFLLSKNYNTDSNNDFIKFGIDSGQHTVGISYSNRANEFYLNIYSINGYLRFRSVVFAGASKLSRHFVINFKNGIPSMYVNGNLSKVLFNYLTSQVFFARKINNRTIAEFACETATENLLVSMISFYNYSLPERIIRTHYLALFDIGDFKDYIATSGAPILYERIPFAQKVARNDGTSQDFFGANTSNTVADFNIQTIESPNFAVYGLDSSYLDRITFAGGTGVASTGGFSFKSVDFKDGLIDKPLAITFSGVSTGRYIRENTLLSIDNTSVGNIYVGIDSASSKVHIGIGTSSILSSMSASVSQSSSVTVYISSDNSTLFVRYSDDSDFISYDFGSTINYDSSIAYLFNRYTSSSVTGEVSAVGNSEIDFDHAYAGTDDDYKLYLSGSLLNSSSNVIWGMNQKILGMATISIPIPQRSQNYFYAADSSDAIVYSLIVDGTASTITNQSVIDIPTTSSNAYLYASLTNYWNGNIYDTSKNLYIQNIALYNFGPASYVAGSFPAILEASNGLINDPDNYLNVFKQNNIGFIQSSSNVMKIYKTDQNFSDIGQIDFLIAIPNALSTASQCLIYTDNNLITNSNFESGVVEWSSDGALTKAQISSDFYSGSSCMQITKDGYPNLYRNLTYYDGISPASGTVFTFSAYVKIPDGNQNVNISAGIFFYGSATYISGVNGTSYNTSSVDGWIRVSASAIVPANTVTTYALLSWAASANTTGQKFLVDSVLLQQSNLLGQYIQGSASMYLIYSGTSSAYFLNFSGMTASVNGTSATSATTKINPRQHYFIQSTLTNYIPNTSSFSVFSRSDSTHPYQHSFDRLSVFPTTATNARDRYAQIFGRKTISVSDNHQNYLQIQSLPDEYLVLNKNWQVYSS